MTQTLAELAAQLIAAHDGGALIDAAPANAPTDRAGAYALQDEIVGQLGAIGGWKIAAGRGDEPLCSPLPQNRFFEADAQLDGTKHRFFLGEVEIAVRLAADIAPGANRQAVETAIGGVHPALEMIANPFTDRAAMPPNLVLGDLQSNGAIVIGPAFDDNIRAELGTLEATLEYDGKPVHSVSKGASWEQTLDALAWLSGHAHSRGMALKAGQVIITGSRALLALDGARTVSGSFGKWGRLSSTIVA
jgi:2-keto-4-pentenoate hydratase